jgi:hypothetical protein
MIQGSFREVRSDAQFGFDRTSDRTSLNWMDQSMNCGLPLHAPPERSHPQHTDREQTRQGDRLGC